LFSQNVVEQPSNAQVFERANDWVDDNGVWGQREAINHAQHRSEWATNSVKSALEATRSIATSNPRAQSEQTDNLKQLTWEEAVYGPELSKSAIRFVTHRNELSDEDYVQWTVDDTNYENDGASTVEVVSSAETIDPPISPESMLVDQIVQSGGSFDAHQTLSSFVAASGTFDSSLQLRSAVLSLFASKEPIAVELVLDRFNQACAAGARLDERALGKSISDYLAPSHVDVTNTLNEFSKLALRNDANSVSHLLVVATVLRLDGQVDRSRLFAQAAFEQAAEKGSLQWNSLIVNLLQ
jgi:hypothetical protein